MARREWMDRRIMKPLFIVKLQYGVRRGRGPTPPLLPLTMPGKLS